MTDRVMALDQANGSMQRLWTWAVGLPGYDKAAWIELEKAIHEVDRAAYAAWEAKGRESMREEAASLTADLARNLATTAARERRDGMYDEACCDSCASRELRMAEERIRSIPLLPEPKREDKP